MTKHFVAERPESDNRPARSRCTGPSATPTRPRSPHAHPGRWAAFADGADEIHLTRTAEATIAIYRDTGSTRDLPPGTSPFRTVGAI